MGGNINNLVVIFDAEGVHKFPLYWTSESMLILSFDYDKISDVEKNMVNFLEQIYVQKLESWWKLREIGLSLMNICISFFHGCVFVIFLFVSSP